MQNYAIEAPGHVGKMELGHSTQKIFVSDTLKKYLKMTVQFYSVTLNG